MTHPTRLLYLNLETMDPGRAIHTHVLGLVEALRRRNWRVELVAETGPRGRGADLVHQFLRYLRLNLRAILRLRRCDGVYIRAHFAAWPLALAAKLARRPVFHEINGVPDEIGVTYPGLRPALGVLRSLYHRQFSAATHLFAVTEGLAGFARDFAGHDRVTCAPNGVDPILFSPDPRPRPPSAPHGAYALFYGDIARWHGLDLMFAAARDRAWPADVTLLLIGRGSAARGPDVPADLKGRVVWLDRMTQTGLVPFIVNARLGLAPVTDPGGRSATGVMPLKLLEMMACGLPVIVTDLPGQADLVRAAACGRAIALDDAAALARAVAEVSASPDSAAMGLRGRAAVAEGYSWDAAASKTEAVMGPLTRWRA